MQAIQVDDVMTHLPRFLLSKALGSIYHPAFWGPWSLAGYREVAKPELPGPGWVRIKTRYGGICGSDMNLVRLDFNLALAHLVSFPFILGHENVGVVAEVGEGVTGLVAGDRVVADPVLSCATRGIEQPCEFCRRGTYSLCLNLDKGSLSPGLAIGFCHDTGGSWAEYFVAHQEQIVLIPDNVSDESALMVEPLSVALRAAMHDLPGDSDTALVMGAGVSGLCAVAALRGLGSHCHLLVVAKYPYQERLALEFGADRVIQLGDRDLLEVVAEETDGTIHRSALGHKHLEGGADQVYECVGSGRSVGDSLSVTRPGGTVVLLGLAAMLKRVDWTRIWLNELTVKGSVWGSGLMPDDRRLRAAQLAVEWMAEERLDLSSMVTHRFDLGDYRQAFNIAAHKSEHQVVKAAFKFE
ncbi:zinc-binding dehydrogenase [Chloroflexota bacterium]